MGRAVATSHTHKVEEGEPLCVLTSAIKRLLSWEKSNVQHQSPLSALSRRGTFSFSGFHRSTVASRLESSLAAAYMPSGDRVKLCHWASNPVLPSSRLPSRLWTASVLVANW